jgi:undecaprenyl-diphosphatase
MLRAVLGRLTLAGLVAVAAMFLFTWLAHEVGEQQTLKIDRAAVVFFSRHQSPCLHTLMTAVSWLAGPISLPIIIPAACVFFWWKGRFWPDGAALLIAGIGGIGLVIGLKELFHRPRPSEVFSNLGYSFPSGHSFFVCTVYGMLAYLLLRDAPARRRRLIWAEATVMIGLVGFSRVFLGVHYPSDVVAGFLVALPWLWGCLALPTWLQRRRQPG